MTVAEREPGEAGSTLLFLQLSRGSSACLTHSVSCSVSDLSSFIDSVSLPLV